MSAPKSSLQRLRVAHLNPNAPTVFNQRPGRNDLEAIAAELELLELHKLHMQGDINAEGDSDWILRGRLSAEVVQPCVVTLKPVNSMVEADIYRHFTPHIPEADAEEVEMPDDALEPLGQFIDLTAIMIEELSLALPEYPRIEGAETPQLDDEAAESDTKRPFANLDKLLKGEGE